MAIEVKSEKKLVRFTPKQLDLINRKADKLGISASELLRRAVEIYFAKKEKSK